MTTVRSIHHIIVHLGKEQDVMSCKRNVNEFETLIRKENDYGI
jgi:hypothetical protein